MSNEQIDLPDVFVDVLDEQDIDIYFQSLLNCSSVECRVKGGATARADHGTLELAECIEGWLGRSLYAIQLIYEWEDAIWCDTRAMFNP